ncbi:MAG TPA: hypothetical protein VEB40_04755, partial [Flavipsychrobacter sp.]|nr:hypothetical protein [Flavipsychrobacter sp.]
MRQFFACIFFLLFASVSYGQNMVINSDLETYGTCPSYFGCLTPQYLPNWNWGTWGSADYYHICAPDPVASVPTHVNGLGYQMPHSGLAYGGIILFDSSSAYKEYALGTLTPLTPGLFYEVTIHLSAANFTMYAVQNIGMYFVQNGLAGTNTLNNLAIVPQANFSTGSPLTDTANWITLIDTFFADSAYSSFLLGNFEVNPIHTFLGYISLSSWDQAYYFFDDILVQPITTAPLSATIVSTNIACYGANTGQAYAWPLGGAYPYSYLWQPGGVTTQTITNLSPGAYTCTITDANNSVVTQTVTITQPPSPVTAAATVLANACNGTNGSAIVTASGGVSPYSYTWAPVGGSGTTANNIPAGTYTVTVTDANGCSTNDVVVVNLSTPINLS